MNKIKFHEALFFCQDGCDVEAFNIGTLEIAHYRNVVGFLDFMPILKPFTPEKLQMLSSYMLRDGGVILTDCAVGERLTDILEEILVFAANGYDVFNWIGQGLAVTQEQYDKMKSDREAVAAAHASYFMTFDETDGPNRFLDYLRSGISV